MTPPFATPIRAADMLAALAALAATPDFFEVTPSDAVDMESPSTGGLRVGTGGDSLAVVKTDDTVVTFANVQSGEYIPVVAKRINATGTVGCDDIVAYVAGS